MDYYDQPRNTLEFNTKDVEALWTMALLIRAFQVEAVEFEIRRSKSVVNPHTVELSVVTVQTENNT